MIDDPDDADDFVEGAVEFEASGRPAGGDGANSFFAEMAQIRQLRSEANALTNMFTRCAFQTVGICSVAVMVMVRYLIDDPYIGLAAIGVLSLALTVRRWGNHCYAVTNRYYGHQLYLECARNVPSAYRGRWRREYLAIGWEEANDAWRVVQPTVFNSLLYRAGLLRPDRYKAGYGPSSANSKWYSRKSLMNQSGSVYPGTEISSMMFLLAIPAVLAGLIMWAMVAIVLVHTVNHTVGIFGWRRVMQLATVTVPTIIATAWTILRFRVDWRRKALLEDGILSIRSSAIIWRATVIAHFEAIETARAYGVPSDRLAALRRRNSGWSRLLELLGVPQTAACFDEDVLIALRTCGLKRVADGAGYAGYSFWLGRKAAEIASKADDILGWIGYEYGSVPEDFVESSKRAFEKPGRADAPVDLTDSSVLAKIETLRIRQSRRDWQDNLICRTDLITPNDNSPGYWKFRQFQFRENRDVLAGKRF